MKSTRHWLPAYCNPEALLPKVQESRTLFLKPPYLFGNFIGKALAFLKTEDARKMGFEYHPRRMLPCKWKCADESLFGVDLAIAAQTGQYPFDKGRIGGYFNEASIGAAVHHGSINLDFGGSHVGYLPGEGGGAFGLIRRPLNDELSSNCGHLCGFIAPFMSVYQDACENIFLYKAGDRVLLSAPNEFLHPNWTSGMIKLLIDVDNLTEGEVDYKADLSYTHTPIGRTIFYASRSFLDQLPPEAAARLESAEPTPIGRRLTAPYFHIFDAGARLGPDGMPNKLLLYMKYIISAHYSPPTLKAAVVNTNLEYNRLIDALRLPAYRDYSFASFTGVFLDMFDDELNNYINFFQPLGLTIKPAGKTSDIQLTPEEIHHRFDRLEPEPPVLPVKEILHLWDGERLLEKFTYRPGYYRPAEDSHH